MCDKAMKKATWSPAVLIATLLAATGVARQGAVPEARVDAVPSQWDAPHPGARWVSAFREKRTEKAYGMADLEHDVRIKPDTIFEAGSVSKQFTAAAILLLAREGKLSLDDPARKYIPELPDYGAPLTIRQMLTHTSGLRDWGSVVAIAGWPRGTRVHTHAHVLDIVSRQRSLNFPSGTRYSYCNTGYNLAAIIVSRVSGQPFAEFTRDSDLRPLGMTRTSWRDDYTRIVKDRAIAYSDGPGGFSHRHAIREHPWERRAPDDGRRSAAVERATSRSRSSATRSSSRSSRRRDDSTTAAARLRAGVHDRHLSRGARSRAQRRDGRLSRMADRSIRSDRSQSRCCAT